MCRCDVAVRTAWRACCQVSKGAVLRSRYWERYFGEGHLLTFVEERHRQLMSARTWLLRAVVILKNATGHTFHSLLDHTFRHVHLRVTFSDVSLYTG